jgi:hypothetical protein
MSVTNVAVIMMLMRIWKYAPKSMVGSSLLRISCVVYIFKLRSVETPPMLIHLFSVFIGNRKKP